MAKTPKQEQTRDLILAGAGRSFRDLGYGGAGVDGLAKAAGLTSGAFYAHFKSKAEAFRETIQVGLQELEQAIRQLRAERESDWVATFVDFYLGPKRTCALTESCALQSLTAEVARADSATRETFERQFRGIVDAVAEGLDSGTLEARRHRAIAMLALLSGGVSLARAVDDPALSQEIARSIRATLVSEHGAKPENSTGAAKKARHGRAPASARKRSK